MQPVQCEIMLHAVSYVFTAPYIITDLVYKNYPLAIAYKHTYIAIQLQI